MAQFEGTIKEFHDFLGPRLRNVINLIAKKNRDSLNGKCEHCSETKELQSAHVHGKDRRSLIESVLMNYSKEGVVRCDIWKVELEILEVHKPIEETFLFLCQSCHVKYDYGARNEPIRIKALRTKSLNQSDLGFRKIGRIRLWAERPHQNNHKVVSAFLALTTKGPVTLSDFKSLCTDSNPGNRFFVENFEGHYAAMKTDNSNSHGNVFYEENGFVHIWPIVMQEIEKYKRLFIGQSK